MLKKCLPLLGALAARAPACAITVNMSDFTFGAADVVDDRYRGQPFLRGRGRRVQRHSPTRHGPALRGPRRSPPTSFVAWCAELTQIFSFGASYEYSQVSAFPISAPRRPTVLSRLFTAAQGFVVDALTSAAMQAGDLGNHLRENPSFSLTGGTFKGAPAGAAGQSAFDVVNGFLTNLGSYQARAQHRRARERCAAGLPGRDAPGAGDVDAVRPRPGRRRPAEAPPPRPETARARANVVAGAAAGTASSLV